MGLYRGYSAVVVGGTPGTMIYLCSYELVKKQLVDAAEARTNRPLAGTGLEFLIHFISGMTAETLSCILYVPVDVVKERMQVQHASVGSSSAATDGMYRSSWDAVKQISKTEGLSGIYRGYAATLGSFGPFSAFYFVFYERLKYWTRQHIAKDQQQGATRLECIDIPFPYLIACSASAGALASFLTSPLDMAKLRLQVQRGQLTKGNAQSQPQVFYSGVFDCLWQVYQEGGVRGLFRGAGARILHFAPATTITMTCFEKCSSFFGRALFSEER